MATSKASPRDQDSAARRERAVQVVFRTLLASKLPMDRHALAQVVAEDVAADYNIKIDAATAEALADHALERTRADGRAVVAFMIGPVPFYSTPADRIGGGRQREALRVVRDVVFDELEHGPHTAAMLEQDVRTKAPRWIADEGQVAQQVGAVLEMGMRVGVIVQDSRGYLFAEDAAPPLPPPRRNDLPGAKKSSPPAMTAKPKKTAPKSKTSATPSKAAKKAKPRTAVAKKHPAKKHSAKKTSKTRRTARPSLRLGTKIERAKGLDADAARKAAESKLADDPGHYDKIAAALETDRVKRRLEAVVDRVASRARALAETHAARRQRHFDRLAALARRRPTPTNKAQIKAVRAQLAADDRAHQVRLRELSRSGACPPMPRSKCRDSCGLKLEGSFCAKDAPLLLPSPDGAPRKVKARYCLTEAAHLVASHDPISWVPRPDYPRDTQERRYESDPHEQLKIVRISEQLRPEVIVSGSAGALEGPPVVTREGLVAGGNGRTMGIQRAYRTGRGDVFRDYLRAHATTFGLRAEDVDAYQQPIVVRVVDVDRAALPRLVRDLNLSTTQALDPLAEAVSAARVLPPSALQALADGLGEDEELSEYLGSTRSKPLVQALEAGGIVTSANRSRLLDPKGLLSEDGRRLVVQQLAAALVADAGVLEQLGGQVRQALARSAPWWLAAGATAGYDVRAAMLKAARDLIDMRRADLTLSQWRRTLGMFEKPKTEGDPLAELLLEVLDEAGGRPIVFSKVARAYRRIAAAVGSTPLLLAADPLEEMIVAAQASGRAPTAVVALQAAAESVGVLRPARRAA